MKIHVLPEERRNEILEILAKEGKLTVPNTHEMNFTTKHESNVTGIRKSVAKRPRRLWIGVSQARLPVVSTRLRIPPCQGSEHDFHIK